MDNNKLISELNHTGKRHALANTGNQDHICSARDRNNTVITLTDGVSSCTKAASGAKICGETVTRLLLRKGQTLQAYEPEEIADMILDEVLYQLRLEADKDNTPVEEYSSTLVSALHDQKNGTILLVSLGDSMIIGVSGNDCYVLANPYDSVNGCCVTTTVGAKSQMSVKVIDDADLDSVILLSDGAWRYMFERDSLKKEISDILARGAYDKLKEFLVSQDGKDDCSFISMDIRKKDRGRREMSMRQYLKKEITLYGESDGKPFERTFTIDRVISEGADGVCYEAYHGKSGKGVLKEFYPLGMPSFERTEKGQLVYATEFPARSTSFREAKNEFIKPYEMLIEMKRNDENSVLSTFIPNFELYTGPANCEEFETTVYVWTPDPELLTFSKICDDIHKHPGERPEYKLFTVIKAIQMLTRCILSLHSMDIIHRDIKPSNFGFKRLEGETLTEVISLFDIDKLCSVWSNTDKSTGTKGYKEPESYSKYSTNQTDIYSIGATLFTALIVTDEAAENGYRYTEEFYDHLADMVKESELIKASEINSHPRLRSILTTILRRSLCKREHRYEDCEELLEDLGKALFYIASPDKVRRNKRGEQWVLTTSGARLDANKKKNSSLVMMYHLFEHPLYSYAGENENQLNIVISGFGLYGPKFLDICLQLAQVQDRTLNVLVITEDDADRELYLEERPELGNFFEINNTRASGTFVCEQPYGRITFDTAEDSSGKAADIADTMRRKFHRFLRDYHVQYAFTDLGDDKLNAEVASSYLDILEEEKQQCLLSYASEGSKQARRKQLHPVYVNSDVKKTALYQEIERMALNTHLVWETNHGNNLSQKKKAFRRPYNHDSCVSNVVSLKYKLHGIGIDLDKCSFEEAARRFNNYISSCSDSEEAANKLAWHEHRRWVTEKLCSGWRPMSPAESLKAGAPRDHKARKHVCIVRSRPERMLSGEFWQKDGGRSWNIAPEKKLMELDEFDRMSVMLHRTYKGKADEIRKHSLDSIGSLAQIRFLIQSEAGEKAPELIGAFSEWYDCIASVQRGERPGQTDKIKQYISLRNSILGSVDHLSKETADIIKADIAVFDKFYYPVLASDEYREWKTQDIVLTKSIPFVLTYTEKLMLIIPFASGDTAGQLFADVLVPTQADPEKILYLKKISSIREAASLRSEISRVTKYLRCKELRASAEFVIICDNDAISDREIEGFIREGGAKLRKVIRTTGPKDDSWIPELRQYLRSAVRGRKVFDLVRNETKLSEILDSTGFYDEFTWAREGDEPLCFISRSQHITAADILCLAGTETKHIERPEFSGEYDELWSMYSKDPVAWRKLCLALRELSAEKDVVAVLKKGKTGGSTYRYILPSFCLTGAAKIAAGLKKCGLVGKASSVTGFSRDACVVTIDDLHSQKEQFDKIFSNIHLLAAAEDPDLFNEGDTVTLMCDNLMITDADCSELSEDLAKYFCSKGYLIIHTDEEGRTSLTYGSKQIKKMLTDPQHVIRLQMYHEARSLGIFDDVAGLCGDHCICIMTKGMKSYFAGYLEDPADDEALRGVLDKAATKMGINASVCMLSGEDIGKQLTEMVTNSR